MMMKGKYIISNESIDKEVLLNYYNYSYQKKFDFHTNVFPELKYNLDFFFQGNSKVSPIDWFDCSIDNDEDYNYLLIKVSMPYDKNNHKYFHIETIYGKNFDDFNYILEKYYHYDIFVQGKELQKKLSLHLKKKNFTQGCK